MKKGYYIHFQGRQSIGVSKKIDMQLAVFRKYYEIQEIEVETPARSLFARVLGLFPTASIGRNYEKAFAQLDDPAFLYVRRTVADRAYLRFWKKVKARYPACKIVIELFTYPYDKDDFGKWNAWPFYVKERIYRPALKKYVDRFVTYSENDEIFGVPTIRTTNGIDVESIPQIGGTFRDGKIDLIGVAFMQRRHGYERILEGLHKYYGDGKEHEYEVTLRLVGDGPAKPFYQKLAKKYELGEHVQFFPTLTGEKLDALYDMSDIALVSFGEYKLNLFAKINAIKSRECLAKGMPLITGCAIDVLPDDYPYAYVFPNNKSVVKIDDIVAFYKRVREIQSSKREMASVIRAFAKECVSMDVVMQPIIDYIEEK